ncbi:MAG: hypothetical protein ACERJ1_08430 [Halodesulfovibrio sp.]|uniref:hypothetical protein n=1 Tax=Halodesulfovibrio sp. TaxID=1912772 RepID=UPI00359E83FC
MSKTNVKVLAVMLLCLAFAATAYAASEEKKPVLPLQPPTQEETEKATDKLNELFKDERPTAKKAAGQNEEKKLASLTPEAKKDGKTASVDTKIEKPVQTAQVEHSKTDKKAKNTKPTLPAKEAAKLSALDLLKSDLELLNVKVEIAQKQKRLKELNHFLKPVTAPKIYRLPRVKNKKVTPPVVLSVQGIGDQLTATLQFQSSGKPVRTVSTGDRVATGTVSTIAHNRVTLTTKNGVIALPFKE